MFEPKSRIVRDGKSDRAGTRREAVSCVCGVAMSAPALLGGPLASASQRAQQPRRAARAAAATSSCWRDAPRVSCLGSRAVLRASPLAARPLSSRPARSAFRLAPAAALFKQDKDHVQWTTVVLCLLAVSAFLAPLVRKRPPDSEPHKAATHALTRSLARRLRRWSARRLWA